MSSSHRGETPALKRGRRPSGEAGEAADRGRWSSQRKMEIVLRILRGEDLDALSRELGLTAHRLAEWRDEFLAGGQAAMKSRRVDFQDELTGRLKAKVGEITMDNELLREKIRHLEANLPPDLRRPRR